MLHIYPMFGIFYLSKIDPRDRQQTQGTANPCLIWTTPGCDDLWKSINFSPTEWGNTTIQGFNTAYWEILYKLPPNQEPTTKADPDFTNKSFYVLPELEAKLQDCQAWPLQSS